MGYRFILVLGLSLEPSLYMTCIQSMEYIELMFCTLFTNKLLFKPNMVRLSYSIIFSFGIFILSWSAVLAVEMTNYLQRTVLSII